MNSGDESLAMNSSDEFIFIRAHPSNRFLDTFRRLRQFEFGYTFWYIRVYIASKHRGCIEFAFSLHSVHIHRLHIHRLHIHLIHGLHPTHIHLVCLQRAMPPASSSELIKDRLATKSTRWHIYLVLLLSVSTRCYYWVTTRCYYWMFTTSNQLTSRCTRVLLGVIYTRRTELPNGATVKLICAGRMVSAMQDQQRTVWSLGWTLRDEHTVEHLCLIVRLLVID